MNILFIGNYQAGPGGEAADETHITRELEAQGHQVTRVSRDEWREYVIEKQPQGKYAVPETGSFDIAIICKWHHFYDARFIEFIRTKYVVPVFYWVWDYMEGNSVEDWHMNMAQAADLYLSGEIGLAHYYHTNDVKFYYFQFDSTDKQFPTMSTTRKEFDVVFTGSCSNQNGKLDLLKEINKKIKIKVFGYDWEKWQEEGFDASPAVYGMEYNRVISQSRIVLGTSAGPNCFGYWSNRIGKVLYAGGFLLQQFTPGMESAIGDACEYFSTADEAVEKIHYYLDNPDYRQAFWEKNLYLGPNRFTSEYKVRQLVILMERYFASNRGKEWMLP